MIAGDNTSIDVQGLSRNDSRRGNLRVFLVAGEESGDRLGGALMQALRRQTEGRVTFSGVGGHAMSAEGLVSLFPIDDIAIMGFHAVPRKLPLILRRIRETAAAIVAARPDVLVIIDSPDFTHRIARRVRAADPSIPIVDYVSPSVWAWRPWRARSMRKYVDHVLALLPFEPDAHRRLGGPPCSYVGHPLADRVGELRPNVDEQRRRQDAPPLLLVLPGSRTGEIHRMLEVFGDAVAQTSARTGAMEVVVPTLPHLVGAVNEGVKTWRLQPRIIVDPAEKLSAFRTARAALTKSGTVTLELALAGVPMVAAYKVSALDAFIARRLIGVSSVILANLVIGENVVPELLQEACTSDRLAEALVSVLSDTPQRRLQVEAFSRLDEIMKIGQGGPAVRAADVVITEASSKGFAAPV